MSRSSVIVLGASGMLGSMVVDVLSRDSSLDIIATVRNKALAEQGRQRVPDADWRLFEAGTEQQTITRLHRLGEAQWVINAIGLTKPYTHDDNPMEIERAINGNSLLPHWLGRTFGEMGARVLQIATDCVYSGAKGGYVESSPHDALDVYGKTKSLGETLLPNVHHLRCSIIGPEPKAYAFLIEWFRRQERNACVSGFTNHVWNGVTTMHFARICGAIIGKNLALPHLQHIVPSGVISKYELLRCFGKAYARPDIQIAPTEAKQAVDRTLKTENAALNYEVWSLAGYADRPPTVPEMMDELASFDYQFVRDAA
jgi:dTDP-4-dehydrorhamnose reductase